jgi:uncharacterized membrane protein
MLIDRFFFKIAIQIGGMFIPAFSHAAWNISTFGGLGLFSLFLAYDTQAMIQRAQLGQADVIDDSINIFLGMNVCRCCFVHLQLLFSDLYNIFIRMVSWGTSNNNFE